MPERGFRLVRVMEPFGEGAERLGGGVGVYALFSVLVSRFEQLALVVGAPNHLQVPVDVELLVVGDVELADPTAESFATAVSVEGTRDSLRL